MAQRSVNVATWSPAAKADATNFVDTEHISIKGSGALDRLNVSEIWIGGQATSSSVMIMVFAAHSTVGVTLSLGTGAKDAALQDVNVAGTARGYNTSTTKPQRSTTLGYLNLSFNSFGGIARWQAPQGKEISIIGNTASLGEAGLSQFTGGTTAAIGSHIIYEPA